MRMQIYTDPATGRSYTVDPVTGRSRWLDRPPSPDPGETQVLPVGQAGTTDGYGEPGGDPVWYPDPAGQEPRRAGTVAMRALGALFVVIVLVTALTLVLSQGGGSAPVAPRRSGQAAAPAPRPPATTAVRVPTIGTPVRDGKFEFTVTGVKTAKRLGNEYVNTTAEGKFLLVAIRVRNVSDKAKTFLSIAQRLRDTQGREYAADPADTVFLWDARNLIEKIEPGRAVAGTLVFDLPSDARADLVRLHDSVLSGGVEVILR
jgi:hypothetical protein